MNQGLALGEKCASTKDSSGSRRRRSKEEQQEEEEEGSMSRISSNINNSRGSSSMLRWR